MELLAIPILISTPTIIFFKVVILAEDFKARYFMVTDIDEFGLRPTPGGEGNSI